MSGRNRRQDAARARLEKRVGRSGMTDNELAVEVWTELALDAFDRNSVSESEAEEIASAEVAQMRAEKRGGVGAGLRK